MSRKSRIEESLTSALSPIHLDVVDDSHKHSVPAGAESHWNVLVVSRAFQDKTRVSRHRAVYAALADEMQRGIHALALETLTPGEWEARGGGIHDSPPCLGGSKVG